VTLRSTLARHAPRFVRAEAVRRASSDAEVELDRILSGPRPIVVGPWLSEVGFEILYWIPLLRKLLGAHGVPSSDVIAASRGGVGSWYDGLADDYVELLDVLGADELAELRRRRRQSSGSEKQGAIAAEERAVVDTIAHARGLEHVGWLHPRLMYRLFERAWSWDGDLAPVLRATDHRRLNAPGPGALAALLPDRPFVAVKAYFSELALPDDAAARTAFGEVVSALAERLPVVLLGTPVTVDEHTELAGGRCIVLRDELDPADNLGQQTAVLARASLLVSTYGGFAYLGPHLGVPTLAAANRSAHNEFHLRLFGEVLHRLDDPPFDGPLPLGEATATRALELLGPTTA
jgi:hypothetical protein